MVLDLIKLRDELREREIDVVRFVYADVLGITRSKDVLVSQLDKAAHNGPAFCEGVWVTTTGGAVLDANNIAAGGLPDLVSKLIPETITPLPWEPGVAYAIVDALTPAGADNMIAPRTVLRKVVEAYRQRGLTPICGPELEFYIVNRTSDGGFERSLNRTGRVYTTGAMVDPDGDFLHLLRMLDQMDIGVFAGNHEFSPGQYEINLWHGEALHAADRTFYFKTAVKDIVARRGKHATFVGKPWSDEGGSGFHLHFSVVDDEGNNLMHDGGSGLSTMAHAMTAGLLEHAAALTALTNPTVNAFKRLGPDTLAPFRANWGFDNRSCMVRVPPERGQGTRLEVRVGDGAANPYLLIAAVLAAALDGIERDLECPPHAEGMAYDNASAPVLPRALDEALDALDADVEIRSRLSEELVNVFMVLKRDEVERYGASVADPTTEGVTEWEVQEYFEDF